MFYNKILDSINDIKVELVRHKYTIRNNKLATK